MSAPILLVLPHSMKLRAWVVSPAANAVPLS